ncbi:MAG: copper-translocating P-type ATPase [Rickettsiales bacterium]|nr:copper-translocating P-type ATPase [Rickettsiales bacterium]
MEHVYKVTGMHCGGCAKKVSQALIKVDGVIHVEIILPDFTAIEMNQHIPLQTLQAALSYAGGYIISMAKKEETNPLTSKKAACCGGQSSKEKTTEQSPEMSCHQHDGHAHPASILGKEAAGKYHCPMHCEGEKVYQQFGNCPICGMNLEQIPQHTSSTAKYTCPMHPEILEDQSGACPICGMDLVLTTVELEDDQSTYLDLLKKFKIAVIFTLPIFVIAMSEMLNSNPLYKIMPTNNWNWLQLVLSIPVVFYATRMFFERAWTSIVSRNFNMFTLIGIGAGIAWAFSIVALLFPSIFPEQFKTEQGTVFVYFEAATVILSLVLLGQLLEAKAHSQTNSAIKELLKLVPATATIVQNGEDSEIPVEQIKRQDVLRIKPGDKIPVDGVLIEGNSSIDESMISGEPIPVDKELGDNVSAGTVNGSRSFLMQAHKVGGETLLSQIIEMVNNASRSKAPIQKLADRISKYFVPIVIVISVLTFIVWAIWGPTPALIFALINSISVLIIACPCALGLATPMSVMVGVGRGAQTGVLIKNAEALEKMNQLDVLIVDKTGTITEGKPSVEKVISVDQKIESLELLKLISSLNKLSEHPLAKAIVTHGQEKEQSFYNVSDFENTSGKGVVGVVNNTEVSLGNLKLMKQQNVVVSPELMAQVETEQQQGKTVSYIGINKLAIGFVAIRDAIKTNSKQAIIDLQQSGIKVLMLTGDNEKTAHSVAKEIGIDFQADCLPEDKLNKVKALQSEGIVVAMAGDGINDAPALAQADVGIAMGTGTDVAIESAEITLVKGNLQGIEKAYSLSHKVMKNIKQNLFFAFIYNVLGVPVAAGVLYPFFGLLLSPMLAALAMSFSSVSVIVNSLRLKGVSLG